MIGIPREQYLTESTLPTIRELSLQNGIFRIADGITSCVCFVLIVCKTDCCEYL